MRVLKIPGLVDAHVHLREPGGEHKEDIASGSAAALAGGVVLVLAMPNTSPPLVDRQTLAQAEQAATRRAVCDVGFFVGGTEINAREAAGAARQACGLKLYLDQTYGPLRMQDLASLVAHFRTWPADRPIAVHAEGLSAAVAIGLARVYGRRLHLCHVSRADEIALIRAAKESGAQVTCEVTPHHLFLTQADAVRLGPLGLMKPALGSEADRASLWANLEVVDCLVTDHAPHTLVEKQGEVPPPGVPGLETMLPLLLTAVGEGRLTMERLVQLTHQAPLRIFGLPEPADAWVEVETGARHTLANDGLHTRCGWTPFAGMAVQGRVRRVLLRGQTAFDDGAVRVKAGFGRLVRPVANAA